MDADKIRVETKEMISITRLDKKLIWLLMPEEKMYMEQVLQSAAMNQKHLPANDSGASDVEREFILRETINGYGADKYKITINKQLAKKDKSDDEGVRCVGRHRVGRQLGGARLGVDELHLRLLRHHPLDRS